MLEATSLTRVFGDKRVVDAVSFRVEPGRITGFVGANGAGKTTTMRMLMGVLAPTSGTVSWDGEPITVERRRTFGYMPEERGLYPRMKVGEQLVYFARLHGMSTYDAGKRTASLLEHFGLTDRADDLLDDLSLGNQQRVQIAAALIHRLTALVLDEPFSGLDPLAVDSMTDLLRNEAADLPLLFSSHQLDLVERLCDDLIVLSAGRVVASGAVEELRERGSEQYRVVLDGEDAAWLRDLDGVEVSDVDGSTALLSLTGLPPADLTAAVVAKSRVLEVARVRQPLSEIFREVTS
ncbi:ABC transporter ATP-binding protein [Marmoricola endophyticus]|uniref:ABC transporter ATP-binding protein n=1 Tax=Marmoricola endophyticus TaxID=2040280 RepID=A0A917BKB9_9ACTN|nr:ATP-binding cassette domain-containing protein [Marmoricola endophyticus]GGF46539.1 ABC transporter ATP-binding protein [Marmoricola endophyticus]